MTSFFFVCRGARFQCGLLVCAVLLFALPSIALADKVPDSGKAREHRKADKVTGKSISLELAGSYQGLGAILRSRIGYKWRLYGHKSPVLENNFFLLNGILQVTPAYANVGANVTIQPLSIFSVSASYMYRIHLPTFTSGTLFKDKEAINTRYKDVNGFLDGDDRLDAQLDQIRKANNGSRPFISGHLINVSATFQLKFKGIIFATNAGLIWNFLDFNDADNSGFLYEPFSDAIVAKTDTQFNISIIAGYEWRNLLFLVIYNHAIMFVSESQPSVGGARYPMGVYKASLDPQKAIPSLLCALVHQPPMARQPDAQCCLCLGH